MIYSVVVSTPDRAKRDKYVGRSGPCWTLEPEIEMAFVVVF